MPLSILRVSQLNRFVKSLLDSDGRLAEVYVRGEIANLSVNARSGHLYFTLRDAESTLRAVLFSSNAAHLRFMPENGMSVIARGAATLYERDGAFQLVTSELMPDGIGTLGLAYEQLKRRLETEGLFDTTKKRPLPRFPLVIGVVTSPSGAALHDIQSTIERRDPMVHLLIAPAQVQGKDASRSIAAAIRALCVDGRSNLIIVTRGGGSLEDLWAFNEEPTVRAVAASSIPVISAIGHETDITLCDFAADLRAATPTAAAELAVPDYEQLRCEIFCRKDRILRAQNALIAARQTQLAVLQHTPALENPYFFIDKNRQRMYNLKIQLYNISQHIQSQLKNRLAAQAALLDLLNPLRVLARGYSITACAGHALTSANSLSPGAVLTTKLADGVVRSTVIEIEKEQGHL